jgi:hypothetical protein
MNCAVAKLSSVDTQLETVEIVRAISQDLSLVGNRV